MEKQAIKEIAKRAAALVSKADKPAFDSFEQEYAARSDVEEKGRQLIVSFRALLEIELLSREAGLDTEFRPRMWWMRGPYPGNFGDVLTPYVLWHAFGVAPRWTAAGKAEGLAIGSIAKLAQPGMKVWGTGMPRDSDPLAPDAIWTAVRGPMSREVVLKAGGSVPEIYGDPAVLLPELYDPEVERTADVGIIPHVLQEGLIRESLGRLGNDKVKIISMRAGLFSQIENVIREIKSCREIISTSLHGVIVAHAYGIPCQSARIVKDDAGAGDSFKMRDYKLSVGLEDTAIGIPRVFDDLAWLEKRVCLLPPRPIDTARLRSAFPFPVRVQRGLRH